MNHEKKRLLLVAATTGYQTRMFAQAAAELDLDVRLATDRCKSLDDPWGDNAIPVRFQDPQSSAQEIARAVRSAPVDGVVAVGDRPALVAAHAAGILGLQFHPPDAVAAALSKFEMRERLRSSGLPVPRFYQLPLDAELEAASSQAPYPCVLKPLTLSGSRGVIRANDQEEFVVAFDRIRRLLETPEILRLKDPRNKVLQVESYIPGREFAVEGVVTDGRLKVLALFEKPDPLEGPYFEETIYVTPSRESRAVQDSIVQAAAGAVRVLGLRHGPLHAEMRVNEQGVWLLEVAARPIGGLCARVLRFSEKESLEHLLVRHAVGEAISAARVYDAASGVMMIPAPGDGIFETVEGVENACATAGIWDIRITAKTGHPIVPLPEGSSYPGFLFARGEKPQDVIDSLKKAHAALQWKISPVLQVLRS